MKKIYSAFVALLPLLAACSPETEPAKPDDEVQKTVFNVSSEAVSRTALAAGYKVNWADGDAISVFDGTSNVQFTTTGTAESAEFTGGALETVAEYYAVYPYNAAATLAGSVISTVIPNRQTGVPDGFDPKAQVMVGRAASGSFAMKNAVALVKVTIPADVTSVTLANKAGVPIAGKVNITVGDGGVPSAVSAEASSVLLVPSGSTFDAGDYYIAVAPGAMTGGL